MGRRTLLLITSILLAAIGVALIAVYVKGADQRAEDKVRLVNAVVLTESVNVGDSITNAYEYQPVTAALAETGITTPQQLDQAGQFATTKLYKGEILQPSMVTKSATSSSTGSQVTGISHLGMSIDIQMSNRAAGLVVPGDSARLWAVDPKTDKLQQLEKSVLVLGVGTKRKITTTSDDPVPITVVDLDVYQPEGEKIAEAESNGDQFYLLVLGAQPNASPPPSDQ